MSNVVYLQKPPRRIAHYLRVGYRDNVLADRMRAEKAATRLNRMRDAFEQTTRRIGKIQFAPEAVAPSGVNAQPTVVRGQP